MTQKGSMITDMFTNNLEHCVHACMVVYMYLFFVMTGQNISNDGDKGVQICISPTFISGNKSLACINAGCTLGTMTVARTGETLLFH